MSACRRALAWMLLGLASCTDKPDGVPDLGAPAVDLGPVPDQLGLAGDPLIAARPYELRVPPGYDARQPAPLVILLHGYGLSGAEQERRFALGKAAGDRGLLYAIPDGTRDESSLRFWNATDGCCNLGGATVDDVAYLRALVRDVRGRYSVDPRRIFLIGHSNGGFMAYRMACDAADLIAGVVSLAGATWTDEARCQPSAPVAVLQVHGDQDVIIRYGGGRFAASLVPYPGARDTVAQWARKNRCTGALTSAGPPLELDGDVAGAETRPERYGGCPDAPVELWTMQGSGHFPELPPLWAERTLDFLLASPKR